MGAFSALFVLLALTTTGAWAETEAPAEPTPTVTPTESPSPEPTPTASPSPTPTPSTRPTPAPSPTENTPPESDPDDNESEDDRSEDDSENEESDDEDDSDDESPEDEPSTTPEPDPAKNPVTTPVTGAPVGFDQAGNLTLKPLVVSALVEPAAEGDPIDASFTASPTSGLAPLKVEFKNTTECESLEECQYSARYAWDFGDNSGSTEHSPPPHTYAQPGTYVVTLTVSLYCGSEGDYEYCDYVDEASQLITVTGPEASFTADPISGEAPLTVAFEDTSTGDPSTITSRTWSFAGAACGSASASTLQHTQTFTTAGSCVVDLTIQFTISSPDRRQASAIDTATKVITVTDDDDDDDDSDDGDDSDNDDGDNDDSDPTPGAFFPNQPPLTGQPTPEPTDPSPSAGPTSRPITPIAPTETVDPEPAGWVTGAGASGAGLALMILAAVIGSMRGLSMAGRRVALVADRDENTIQRHVAARDAEGWGDRSFTWRFPGHRLIDAASVIVPDRLFRFSPLVGRITEDGSEFRAMFGSLWLATPLAGIALGLASASAAGGRALPPSVWLVAAGAVLATFDAFSGAVAVVLFAGAALLGGLGGAQGGPDTVHSLLVILAIGFLWMAIPLIGSAIRPFRRLGDGSLLHRWNVLGDGLIAALLCGWVAQKLTQAMDLFAGQETGLPEHANTVAVVVMAAVALRVTMEHFTMSAYPQRLQQVEGEDPPSPFLASVVLGAFVRTAVFGFIGYAFIGSCWQLWLGIGLFLIPQLIDHLRERFRNIGVVQRILPRGVVEIFILVVTCTLIARYAMNQTPDEFTGLRMAFLLIAIPPALLGILRVFAEDPDDSGDTSWIRQFLGALIVAVTVVLAARGWDY